MILASNVIKRYMNAGMWKGFRNGEPIKSEDLKFGPHSVDVAFGDKIMVPDCQTRYNLAIIDPYNPDSVKYNQHHVEKSGYIIRLYQLILGYVQERFDCSELTPYGYFTQMYDGRSTMGRLGIISHCTAGYGDLGFDGNFTLEIVNCNRYSIMLHPGMRIGQISFVRVLGADASDIYSGSYCKQYDAPRAPVLGRDKF